MPGGPGVPNRNVHFSTGAHDDPPFDLPPEKEAYYSGTSAGEKLREQMKGMSVQERHEHMRGLRETLNDSTPKPGDFDNPLRKDLPREATQGPREPAAPRQPRRRDPVVVARQNRTRIKGLARKAKGRRR
jgi:hypothetical protein